MCLETIALNNIQTDQNNTHSTINDWGCKNVKWHKYICVILIISIAYLISSRHVAMWLLHGQGNLVLVN